MTQHIKGIPPPLSSAGPDKIAWSHTSSGNFSVKTTYKVLREGKWNLKDEKWKSVWKMSVPQRVCFFIWTALQGRLLNNAERVRRGFAVDSSCPVCGYHSEDILHILRDCTAAKDVWNQISLSNHLLNFFSSNNTQDWLFSNMQNNSSAQ